jgi:uncharacterized protein DUF4214
MRTSKCSVIFLVIFLLFSIPIYYTAAQEPALIDEESIIEELQSQNENNRRKEENYLNSIRSPQELKKSRQSSMDVQWVASDTFTRWDDVFNITVGRGNYIWIYIEPVDGYPFICSPSFTIIQDGIQYDNVKLVSVSGESQCGDVYIPQIYNLTFWSFVKNPADLSREFTLIYDAEYVYSLYVPLNAPPVGGVPTGVEGFVTRFYQQCLGREPDQAGLDGWVNALRNGSLRGADVAYGFVFSLEFVNRNTTNDDFVTILYAAFFNRAPDTGGYNNWLNYLASGASRNDVLYGFTHAQEFNNLCEEYGITPN